MLFDVRLFLLRACLLVGMTCSLLVVLLSLVDCRLLVSCWLMCVDCRALRVDCRCLPLFVLVSSPRFAFIVCCVLLVVWRSCFVSV